MANGIARKGDQDDLGYTIESDCSPDVKINGQPVALKGSMMDDGVAITSEVSSSVRVNGRFVALKGSITEYHEQEPKGIGTINQASDDTKAGDGGGKATGNSGSGVSTLFSGAVPASPFKFTGPIPIPVLDPPSGTAPYPEGKAGDAAPSAIPAASDIPTFLATILREAKQWTRKAAPLGPKGNANIVECFKQCGAPQLGESTPWCAAFVSFVLKQCGYKCNGELNAFKFLNNRSAIGAELVSNPTTAQPGDIAIWSYGHVNFVYTNNGGKLTFCGGNQSGASPLNNNPSGSSVTIAWPTGWSPSNGSLLGIVRPVKA